MSSVKIIKEITTVYRFKMEDIYGEEVYMTIHAPCLEVAILKAYNTKSLALPEKWREMYGVDVTLAGLEHLKVPIPKGYKPLTLVSEASNEAQEAINKRLTEANIKTLDIVEQLGKDFGVLKTNALKPKLNVKGSPKKSGRQVGHVPSNRGKPNKVVNVDLSENAQVS